MADYFNDASNADPIVAIGSPSIGATGDSVFFTQPGLALSTNASGFGGTNVLDRILFGGAFDSDVFAAGGPFVLPADIIQFEDWAGQLANIAGRASHTVDALIVALAAGGRVNVSSMDVTDFEAQGPGEVELRSSADVTGQAHVSRGTMLYVRDGAGLTTLPSLVVASGGRAVLERATTAAVVAASAAGQHGRAPDLHIRGLDGDTVDPNITAYGGNVRIDSKGSYTLTVRGHVVLDLSGSTGGVTVSATDVDGRLDIIKPRTGIGYSLASNTGYGTVHEMVAA